MRTWSSCRQLIRDDATRCMFCTESGRLRRKEFAAGGTTVSPGGAQIRRLLTGYLLLGTVSIAVAASGMILQAVELPGLAYHKLITESPIDPQLAAPGMPTAGPKQGASTISIGGDEALGTGARDVPRKEDPRQKPPPADTARETAPRYVFAAHGVNIRKSPNGEILRTAEAAERLQLLGKERTWNKIRLADGTEAFIHDSVVTDPAPPLIDSGNVERGT